MPDVISGAVAVFIVSVSFLMFATSIQIVRRGAARLLSAKVVWGSIRAEARIESPK